MGLVCNANVRRCVQRVPGETLLLKTEKRLEQRPVKGFLFDIGSDLTSLSYFGNTPVIVLQAILAPNACNVGLADPKSIPDHFFLFRTDEVIDTRPDQHARLWSADGPVALVLVELKSFAVLGSKTCIESYRVVRTT